MKNKHFNPDLNGWEEKDEPVKFPLVSLTENRVYFSGLPFEKINEQEMNIYVHAEKDTVSKELKFSYARSIYSRAETGSPSSNNRLASF